MVVLWMPGLTKVGVWNRSMRYCPETLSGRTNAVHASDGYGLRGRCRHRRCHERHGTTAGLCGAAELFGSHG